MRLVQLTKKIISLVAKTLIFREVNLVFSVKTIEWFGIDINYLSINRRYLIYNYAYATRYDATIKSHKPLI